jgi:hypothetical protein
VVPIVTLLPTFLDAIAATREELLIDAAIFCGAAIIGARVAVVTVLVGSRRAFAIGANIVLSTAIAIIAWQHVEQIYAALVRSTGIPRANVIVIAILRFPRLTFATRADIVHGAGIVVLARVSVGDVFTAGLRVTRVNGARVTIVAIQQRSGHTHTFRTGIAHGAIGAVTARPGQRTVLTTRINLAPIFSAYRIVIAIHQHTHADSSRAEIPFSTLGAVITFTVIGHKLAAHIR